MTLVLLAGMVQAASVEGPLERPAPPVEEMGASKGSGSNSGSSSSGSGAKKDTSTSGSLFKKGKIWGWTYRPYVTPGGGLTIGNGGTAITGGAEVGIKYSKKKWRGDVQAGGSYTSGAELNGYDVHIGNEFGRREKWWGLTAGLLGFYNGYLAADGAEALDPSLGLDVPVELVLGPKKYYAYGTITPSFLFNEDRHVPGLPFGDELEWGVGAGVKLKWITAEAGFTSRITTVGVINTPHISVSVSGLD